MPLITPKKILKEIVKIIHVYYTGHMGKRTQTDTYKRLKLRNGFPVCSVDFLGGCSMSWFYLLLAGLFEVVWATTMKMSDGFSNLKYSLLTLLGMVFSFLFLSFSIKQLPLSIAYPIWTGIGAVGSIVIGVVIFKDSINPLTWFFIGLLIIGIIGIKVTSGH